MSGSVASEEQASMQIASTMGMSLEGGNAESSQQDISTLLQNIDSKQLKITKSGFERNVFEDGSCH